MKALVTSSLVNYSCGFFVRNWSLTVIFRGNKKKVFFLGQDVKWCHRILGVDLRDVLEISGVNIKDHALKYEINQLKLGRFIKGELGLTSKKCRDLEPWELCCQ